MTPVSSIPSRSSRTKSSMIQSSVAVAEEAAQLEERVDAGRDDDVQVDLGVDPLDAPDVAAEPERRRVDDRLDPAVAHPPQLRDRIGDANLLVPVVLAPDDVRVVRVRLRIEDEDVLVHQRPPELGRARSGRERSGRWPCPATLLGSHPEMEELTAGRAIVETWQAEGVRHVFGLPGGHVLSIYDALYDTPEIRHVLVRHEHAAACMASAYAQLTGEPGVCLVTAGPGATNLATGIAEAYVGSLPLVAVAGRGATANAHRGAAQEVRDRAALRADHQMVGAGRSRRSRVGGLARGVRDRAQRQAGAGLRRCAARPARHRDRAPRLPAGRAAARARPPTRVAWPRPQTLLAGAERPLIVAGGGTVASGAWDELRALAELLGAPVITTLAGRGSIPDDHPLSVGGLGAHRNRLSKRLLADADLVLGLGCRFEEMETNWRPGYVPAPDALYMQVDIDAAEIGRSIPAHLGLVGDIGPCSPSSLETLRGRGVEARCLPDYRGDRARRDRRRARRACCRSRPPDPSGARHPRHSRGLPARDDRRDRRRRDHAAHRGRPRRSSGSSSRAR